MTEAQRRWSLAFARQARADFDTYNALAALPLPPSQSLHFLQMTCEKLCKATLCQTADPSALQSSHGYITRTLRSSRATN